MRHPTSKDRRPSDPRAPEAGIAPALGPEPESKPEPLRVRVVVLNYNGRGLLEECLPTILEAADNAPFPCAVTVVDNDSRDDSPAWLDRRRAADPSPRFDITRLPNRGLASFNVVAERVDEPYLLLLNNDVKLAPDAIAPLVRALIDHPDAGFSAPLCLDFDGVSYEGSRARLRERRGLIQCLCRVPGHRERMFEPCDTPAAGPVLAVDRRFFLEVGGYDPIYFPGRIEDLDLGFKMGMAGRVGKYVPESRAWHRGAGAFGPAFGDLGNDRLAFRNTLLFAWMNLGGARLLRHVAWLPPRLAESLIRGRWHRLRAFGEALRLLPAALANRARRRASFPDRAARERAFLERFPFDEPSAPAAQAPPAASFEPADPRDRDRLPMSALVIARDEADNLPACLDALAFCEERIVVVDPASRDDTEAVARRLADRTLVRPFDDFASQREAGRAIASRPWILSIDADERVTPALAEEIRAAVRSAPAEVVGFRVPIVSEILGRPFVGSGTKQDAPLRLFRRDAGRWVGLVHETVDIEGTVRRLRNHLTHATIPDLTVFLRKIDFYTTLEARRAHDAGERFRPARLLLRPPWVFLRLYFARLGFRDGWEGLLFCALSAVSAAAREAKLRELDLRSAKSKSAGAAPPGTSAPRREPRTRLVER